MQQQHHKNTPLCHTHTHTPHFVYENKRNSFNRLSNTSTSFVIKYMNANITSTKTTCHEYRCIPFQQRPNVRIFQASANCCAAVANQPCFPPSNLESTPVATVHDNGHQSNGKKMTFPSPPNHSVQQYLYVHVHT